MRHTTSTPSCRVWRSSHTPTSALEALACRVAAVQMSSGWAAAVPARRQVKRPAMPRLRQGRMGWRRTATLGTSITMARDVATAWRLPWRRLLRIGPAGCRTARVRAGGPWQILPSRQAQENRPLRVARAGCPWRRRPAKRHRQAVAGGGSAASGVFFKGLVPRAAVHAGPADAGASLKPLILFWHGSPERDLWGANCAKGPARSGLVSLACVEADQRLLAGA